MKLNRSISIMLVCIILGVIITLQYKSIYKNNKAQSSQYTRLEDLKDQLIIEKNNNDSLRKRNDELIKQVTEYENTKGSNDAYREKLKNELDRARLIAGLTSVKGKGAVVTLTDTDYQVVQEGDLLSLINELRATDAQAISINNQRVVAMTEIREAGGHIVVNGESIKSPYIIKVIIDPDMAENGLKLPKGVLETFDAYKIKYSFEKSNEINIEKVKDNGIAISIDMLTPVE